MNAQRLIDMNRNYWRTKDDWHSAMRQARKAGMTYAEIARITGVSAGTVRRMVG